MPVTGTNYNYFQAKTGDVDISAQALTLPTYFAKYLEPYAKADNDMFTLMEYLSWNGAKNNAPQTSGLIGAIVPGKDGLHRVSKRGRLFIPLELDDDVISGAPSATSTYTITGAENYNAAGTKSMAWVGQTIDFPNGTGLPIRGTITSINTAVNNAHVITVTPRTGDTLPSIAAGTQIPVGTYSSATGSTPDFFTPIRNETEWYNCFQNILNGIETTDSTGYYANMLEINLSANPELAMALYPDGKVPDARHYVYSYVLDWLRYHMKYVKDACWFGQFEQTTASQERNDKMEGFVTSIRNSGQNYTYIAGTNTTAVMTQLCLDLDATMLNANEYLLYPGNELRATIAADFMTYANNSAIRYDFFNVNDGKNPISVAQQFAFKPLEWNGYLFHICESFTPFYDPSVYGGNGYDMKGDAIGIPVGYAQKADNSYAQNFSILYATDGGRDMHNLVDMRVSEGVRRNRLVQLSRDRGNLHKQSIQQSIDSWLTTRLLNVEAAFYLQRV